MLAGSLDQVISIEKYTETIDSVGQRIPTWSTLVTCWANAAFDSGKESIQADQKVATRVCKFTVRYNALVNECTRVLWDSQYYDVVSIEPIGRQEGQILTATRRDRT